MNRVLLALLALLAGLVAQPVQARGCAGAGMEIGEVQGARTAQRQVVPIAHALVQPLARIPRAAFHAPLQPISRAQAAPAVLIGIDRARQ